MLVKTELSRLESDILENILNGDIAGIKKNPLDYPIVAYIVWIEKGEIEMGPCRWGHRSNLITADGKKCDTWNVSPFPGAWVMIPITQIVRVRHIAAI